MLLRYDPFRELDRATEGLWANRTPAIPMDAVRHGDRVFITFDLPGVDPDAIDLTVERGTLTLKAERRFQRSEGDQVLADERRQGTFTRRVLLGDTLDTGHLEAAQPRKIAVGGTHAQEAIETTAS